MHEFLTEQFIRLALGRGFFAALDQSGGSTPGALELYGIDRSQYRTEEEMFALIQAMRERIIRSPSFLGTKVLAAILFEKTVHTSIEGEPVCSFLWNRRSISSFLKVDEGLETEENGVQLMKPLKRLPLLLDLADEQRMVGTKMRSLIHQASAQGISEIVKQQFAYARSIADTGLLPILEPEVSTKLPDAVRDGVEEILAGELLTELNQLPQDHRVMLKLTIPVTAHRYDSIAKQLNVVRVLALSGGFSLHDAARRLGKNVPMIASFSRALLEDLRYQMTDQEFDQSLSCAIEEIYAASTR